MEKQTVLQSYISQYFNLALCHKSRAPYSLHSDAISPPLLILAPRQALPCFVSREPSLPLFGPLDATVCLSLWGLLSEKAETGWTKKKKKSSYLKFFLLIKVLIKDG